MDTALIDPRDQAREANSSQSRLWLWEGTVSTGYELDA
jgi:hypothetical protein